MTGILQKIPLRSSRVNSWRDLADRFVVAGRRRLLLLRRVKAVVGRAAASISHQEVLVVLVGLLERPLVPRLETRKEIF